MDDELLRQARSFGSVAEVYDRGRPSFPREAAEWLTGEQPVTVLELGAGTGKLTEQLVALGHDVHATDPDEAMLDVLRRRLPDTRTSVAAAEELPVADRSVDVVVAAQCFHWFDLDRALPEIARVLKPGGHIAPGLEPPRRADPVGPQARPDHRQPRSRPSTTSPQPLVLSGLFGFVEDATFQHLAGRSTASRSRTSSSPAPTSRPSTRRPAPAKLAEVLAFYDDYGRGMDGMQLPYDTQCFKAVVTDRLDTEADDEADAEPTGEPPSEPPSDGTDTDMLLIDFR